MTTVSIYQDSEVDSKYHFIEEAGYRLDSDGYGETMRMTQMYLKKNYSVVCINVADLFMKRELLRIISKAESRQGASIRQRDIQQTPQWHFHCPACNQIVDIRQGRFVSALTEAFSEPIYICADCVKNIPNLFREPPLVS